ncbi:MAG: DNA mismatch repair endonuclease MutL [Myxococcales bacterium]|nr:DNA mismatch repair endonuclease MutL [Myxococcales bacterium]
MTTESDPTAPPEKGRIRLLSDALVDQIAAGEVVERPASVVKELVENSLDAEARRIRVEVRDGGAALIAVTDDGVGMTPAELPMALQRHATSKLRSAADLMRIASFGFRGEALPAIASVSRFRIVSRARGHDTGYEIRCDAGRVVSERAAGAPEGTRIEVADLFAAVPARRKFLKRAGTEWGHIADWLARLALVRPDIHVELQRDDRDATVWPTCRSLAERVAMILPDDDAAALVEIEYDTPEARIHAFVSSPERTRPNGQGLYLYVNGRPVRDRLLRHALTEAYRDLLPRGRFPVAVLLLEVPPDSVDVNVHPAKWEVRFADPQAIHRAIRRPVREAMTRRAWLGGVRAAPPPSDVGDGAAAPPGMRAGAQRAATYGASGRVASTSAPGTDDWIFAGRSPAIDRVAESAGHELQARAEASPSGRAFDEGALGPPSETTRPVPAFGSLRLLGQLRASYLLAESDRGLIVVDQHAAHERILYEGLRQRWLEQGVARQGLLVPQAVSLSADAVAALEEGASLVERLGFEVEAFGEGTVLVRAIPAELTGRDVGELVGELAAALGEVERGDDASEGVVRWLPGLDRLFATMACHAARRFGDRLPEAEQAAILSGLDTIPWAPTCPHGRPVAILLDHADLEQRFRRR